MNRYRSLIVATPSGTADRPISVADAKEHLRIVDNTTDDDYIGDLIDAATQWCEDFCERTFADKQYTVAFDDFMSVRIELPRPPVRLHVLSHAALNVFVSNAAWQNGKVAYKLLNASDRKANATCSRCNFTHLAPLSLRLRASLVGQSRQRCLSQTFCLR